MSNLISPTAVRKRALEVAKELRPAARFTRVSKEFVDCCEAQLRNYIVERVRRHPSIGVTLK